MSVRAEQLAADAAKLQAFYEAVQRDIAKGCGVPAEILEQQEGPSGPAVMRRLHAVNCRPRACAPGCQATQ